jgi:SAM-dependent methyltransferase
LTSKATDEAEKATDEAEGGTFAGRDAAVTAEATSSVGTAYGGYVLRTGAALAEWEDVFSRYVFDSRFRGHRPILELGPGRCSFTRQAPADIMAVDNAPEVVDRFSAMGLQVYLGSAYDIPFPDSHFSAAYSCWLLEHLDDPLRCLRAVHRVLRPGGYMYMIVPSADALLRGFYDDYTHIRPFTPVSLRQLAEDAGFRQYKVEALFWTRGLRRLIPLLGKDRVVTSLGIADHYVRRARVTNHLNFCLEAWK